ncbi:histidinol phosphatase [Flagellimonas aquimarina]|uniref:protein-tyrosine-phosphatase n=1 Tax=Flagellimonas aquimarina TaxID=2201895 RepID=A0A316KY20_9FLAO|nr:CpsB/CapC family capsule biosynthesis tyrosine phosphatase [Allomuricauda koreensis]PWL39137.1 histidinol phosphatase [Allomuricauda koreensis]
MFSFFQKKVFLADYLHGLVDMHNHILPGIDDGAKTVDESIKLIKEFSELGVKNFVCTPHIMNHYYPNTPDTIKDSFNILWKELIANNMDNVRIDYAAEHMVDDNFDNLLDNKNVMPLKEHYLLVEMSYLQPSFGFNGAIQNIVGQQYFPILAHPERYLYYHQKYDVYKNLKSMGILFQLNFLSLSGYYGSEIQKTAKKLLDDGLIEFAASDVHNMKQLNAIKEIKISTKTLNCILPVIENTIKVFY